MKSRVRLFEGDESKQTQKLKSLVTVERKGGDVALGWSLSHAMHVADVKYADKIKTTVDFKVPLSGGGGGLGPRLPRYWAPVPRRSDRCAALP